jgi:uncharacterized protein (TIGR02466 family)
MRELHVQPIFPVGINHSELNREFTKEEISFFQKCKESETIRNTGNTFTENYYILNEPEMKNLKNDLMMSVNHYFYNVLQAKETVEPYITISWINFTEKNQFHHKHYHPNSYLSGVFYIDVDEKKDSIFFFNSHEPEIVPEFQNFNLFNAPNWNFTVRNKLLLLFPSRIKHEVSIKDDNNTRISLSFNVFLRGDIGAKLTELKL